MANVAVSWAKVDPSFVEPEILLQYNQASGAFNLLAGEQPRVKLGEGDLYVYIKRLDIRTRAAFGQAAGQMLPSASIVADFFGTATYLIRTRSEFDHHDTSAMGRWGADIMSAQRLAREQGTFQQLRNALLYGFNPVNNEGLVNQVGATAITLPADSYGNATIQTYDNGELAFFFAQQVLAAKTRMFQLGVGRRVSVTGPQRVLGLMEYNVVQVTSYQRQGGGTMSSKGTLQEIMAANGDTLDWNYDDTLIGKGAGGTDMVVMTIPEIVKPAKPINTNSFAELAPGLDATVLQYMDMAAPRDIPTPLPGGAIDIVGELRASSGWAPRPQAVSLISIPY